MERVNKHYTYTNTYTNTFYGNSIFVQAAHDYHFLVLPISFPGCTSGKYLQKHCSGKFTKTTNLYHCVDGEDAVWTLYHTCVGFYKFHSYKQNWPRVKNHVNINVPNGSYTGVRVTKALFVNFSIECLFDLAQVPVRSFRSHYYLTGGIAVQLWWHLSNMKVIYNMLYVFWLENLGKFGKIIQWIRFITPNPRAMHASPGAFKDSMW